MKKTPLQRILEFYNYSKVLIKQNIFLIDEGTRLHISEGGHLGYDFRPKGITIIYHRGLGANFELHQYFIGTLKNKGYKGWALKELIEQYWK